MSGLDFLWLQYLIGFKHFDTKALKYDAKVKKKKRQALKKQGTR